MASFKNSSYKDEQKYKESKRRERRRRIDRYYAFLDTLKSPCLFCGEEDPRKIEFHHVNKNEKELTVGNYPIAQERARKEVEKCWCLCKSCHDKLHWRLCDPLPHLYDTLETITDPSE